MISWHWDKLDIILVSQTLFVNHTYFRFKGFTIYTSLITLVIMLKEAQPYQSNIQFTIINYKNTKLSIYWNSCGGARPFRCIFSILLSLTVHQQRYVYWLLFKTSKLIHSWWRLECQMSQIGFMGNIIKKLNNLHTLTTGQATYYPTDKTKN